MNKLPKNTQGFTIIELLIATSIFSVVLLLCTTGIIQVTNLYYKGITATRTQEAARNIIEEISRGIQYSGGRIVTPVPGAISYFCIGSTRYSYVTDRKLVDTAPTSDDAYHVLVTDTNANCSTYLNIAPLALPAGSKELMTPDMRLISLTITNTPAGSSLYIITVRVVSGKGANLDSSHKQCDGGSNNQFCAASELRTTVQKRIQ